MPLDRIEHIANESINFETAKVTALSTTAGIPGGLAMLGTVPADIRAVPIEYRQAIRARETGDAETALAPVRKPRNVRCSRREILKQVSNAQYSAHLMLTAWR